MTQNADSVGHPHDGYSHSHAWANQPHSHRLREICHWPECEGSETHNIHPIPAPTCRFCGADIYPNPGHSGRYAWTDKVDGTDIFGSGSECPKNERGHEPRPPIGRSDTL